ncbi:DUF4832 domain-containing protein [Rhodopirellula sp. MGV]|uniref:DUF4832 domain-containing protein n=1 Tax=Rhodopirellula sp. MGV TaxID=2023130 RepID=UPI0013044FAB|nr:DUF4832 domain-containing protein [Rhodopirellula sp. MGV]
MPHPTIRGQSYALKPAPSPAENPLKGLVPYARPAPNRFPHSMEFQYLPLSDLMLGMDQFDWSPMERLLDDIASRGNQAVVRVYMEYPGKEKGIPQFLVDGGLRVHRYPNTNTAPFPPTQVTTPDYEDANLREALRRFIAAWGKAYDGDPRLAYITAGLLGTWGEWHTYPKDDLWASHKTQAIVLDAYATAFRSTPVLLRYPAGPDHGAQVENANRPFGYHDDSFAWATLETGRRQDDWFYMSILNSAGAQARNKWKSHPIGGEIRPEVWGKIFDSPDQWPDQAQNFHECVSVTHATWLMDTGMFRKQASPERLTTAITEVGRMGYDFYVRSSTFQRNNESRQLDVTLEILNQGVAPFYADWPSEIAIATTAGKIVSRQHAPGFKLQGLLPAKTPHRRSASIPMPQSGEYFVLLRVVNPLPGGKPLRFANVDQDATKAGWLTLGKLMVE